MEGYVLSFLSHLSHEQFGETTSAIEKLILLLLKINILLEMAHYEMRMVITESQEEWMM
jgi:hypothetical protein